MHTLSKLKGFLKNSLGYFSLFTLVFGTVMTAKNNNAEANNVGNGLLWNNETGAVVFNISSKILTIIAPATNEGTEKVTGITAGAGVTGNQVVVFDANADINTAISGTAIVDGAFTVKVGNNEIGDALDLDLGDAATDIFTLGSTLILNNIDTANATLLVTLKGATTVAGVTTLISIGAANIASNTVLAIADAATFTGAVVINDGVATAGNSKILISTDGIDTIAFNGGLTAAADGEGLLHVNSGTAIKTITGTIGTNTVRLGEIDIDTANDVFSGAIFTDDLDVAAAVTFSSAVTATTGTVAGALIFADNLTVDGATELAIGNGSITIKGTTLTGGGTTGIDTAHANAKIVFDAAAGDQTMASKFTAATDDNGTVENSNVAGTVTFSETLGAVGGNLLKLIDTDTSTTSLFSKEIGTELFTVDGEAFLTLDNNQATKLDLNTGGTIVIGDTITDGQQVFLVATGMADGDIAGTGNIELPSNLADGQTLVLATIDDDNAVLTAVVADAQLAIKDTSLRTFTVSGNQADEKITVTSVNADAATAAANLGLTKNQGASGIQALEASVSEAALIDIFSNVLNERGFDANEDTKLVKEISVQNDIIVGSTKGITGTSSAINSVVSNRMASLRSGDAYVSGVAAGAGVSANSGFIQIFGNNAEQKNTSPSAGVTEFGYEANTQGVAIGLDGMTDSGSILGLSISYSDTDVDGKGAGKATSETQGYTATVYADKAGDNGYVEGSFSYGVNKNKNARIVTSSGIARNYRGIYDSTVMAAKVSAGVPKEVSGGAFFTPYVGVTGTTITTDAYTETSSSAGDSLRLRIAQDDITSILGTIGLKYHAVTDYGTPMVSVAVNNEFGDTKVTSMNTYQGGGTAFKTETNVEETSATIGLGYRFGSDTASIDIGYEGTADRNDYLGHYGQIKLVSKF